MQQEISKGLDSDLEHSLSTFRNIAHQRNRMLSREAALLADLPSLKALMTTQDAQTIRDGSEEFWTISGSDFFALSSANGRLLTHSNRGPALSDDLVTPGVQACMAYSEDPCMIAFGRSLYELSIQPLYFGPPANGSQLGYVVLGYAIDHQVVHEVSEAAAADVAFLVDGEVAATTVPSARLPDLGKRIDSTRRDERNLPSGSSLAAKRIWLRRQSLPPPDAPRSSSWCSSPMTVPASISSE